MPLEPRPGPQRIRPHMLPASTTEQAPAWAFLNSNENGFGPSPLAQAAAAAAVGQMARYFEFPDETLAPAIAHATGVRAEQITTGQGSDDLIARLARLYLRPGDLLMRSANGYQKVPNYAYANDVEVIHVPDEGFVPSVDNMIAAMTDAVRIVYLANPENPAGTYLPGAEIRRLHAAMPDHALLLLDCAYQDYVDAEDYEAGEALVDALPRTVLCRTFSKIYGLAGARVGWCYGPEDVIDLVRRIGLTFPVASVSAAAAIAALEDTGHLARVRGETLRNRAYLSQALSALGLHVVPSQTNFVLVHSDWDAAGAEAHLRGDGIVVRRLASPAFRDCIRITIGTEREMRATVHSLATFLGAG